MTKINDKIIENTVTALKQNNMNVIVVKTVEDVINELKNIIPQNATTGHGGSMTIEKSDIENYLKSNSKYTSDRKLHPSVDYYLASANAITEDGKIYQVDGFSNRVACLSNGPGKVIIIASTNKIVKNEDEAKHRVMTIAAPKNAIRLNRNTPCAKTGECIALKTGKRCLSPDRICSNTLVMEWQLIKDRVTVILVTDKKLGY